MDDPNLNPAWDAVLGRDTDTAVLRLLGLMMAFVVIGGALFWSVG